MFIQVKWERGTQNEERLKAVGRTIIQQKRLGEYGQFEIQERPLARRSRRMPRRTCPSGFGARSVSLAGGITRRTNAFAESLAVCQRWLSTTPSRGAMKRRGRWQSWS